MSVIEHLNRKSVRIKSLVREALVLVDDLNSMFIDEGYISRSQKWRDFAEYLKRSFHENIETLLQCLDGKLVVLPRYPLYSYMANLNPTVNVLYLLTIMIEYIDKCSKGIKDVLLEDIDQAIKWLDPILEMKDVYSPSIHEKVTKLREILINIRKELEDN